MTAEATELLTNSGIPQLVQCDHAAADGVDLAARLAERHRHGSPDTARRACDEGCRHLGIPSRLPFQTVCGTGRQEENK